MSAASEARCKCGVKLAAECDEEWGPDCDLGNNEAHVAVHAASEAQPDSVEPATAEDMKVYDQIAQRYSRDVTASEAQPEAIYLVHTGETHEGLETYTRHEGRPPPLCDYEGPLIAAKPPESQVGATGVYWLVESKFKSATPRWWNGKQDGDGVNVTADPNAAIRFARKEDAEKVAAGMHMFHATEHVWPAATPASPPAVVRPPEPVGETPFDQALSAYCQACWRHDNAGMRAGYIRIRDLFAAQYAAPTQAPNPAQHDLFTDADADAPAAICDSNGQVVLGLCKRCGKAEAELDGPCTP